MHPVRKHSASMRDNHALSSKKSENAPFKFCENFSVVALKPIFYSETVETLSNNANIYGKKWFLQKSAENRGFS